ncbi:DNA mismatch repair protein [Mycena kentingensis (nom. inval.)]|nr:DNA mismatch repair protein [Mycena kentingensis (nom. inval.)]
MPPKSSQSASTGPKQKSLMSFFAKPPPKQPKQSTSQVPQTPQTKGPSPAMLNSSAVASTSSGRASSTGDTPPTSDIIDVDMLSEEEEDQQPPARVTTGKRKIVIDDSDEERMVSAPGSTAASSPTEGKKAAKKARLSALLSNDDEEDDEGNKSTSSAFSQRLTHFKKSPVKKVRKSSAVSDDDGDFIVSDSDADTRSIKSTKSASSGRSSRRSVVSDDEEEDSEPRPKKKAAKAKAAPKASATPASSGGGGSNLFLTAAEQREQDKKKEKKEAESPYSFLQNVKDKDGNAPDDPAYDPRTLYIPSKAWKEFTPFEKQFWEIKQNHYDTILFFQKGKFLELYEDDARIGHQEFDLKLTSRVKMSMVGVPESSFNFWAAKFLGAGYKVGRVDQAETALGAEMRLKADKSSNKSADKGKDKIVRRELNKVYTNGTLIDPEMLTDEQAGHFISISETFNEGDDSVSSFGVSVLDCATSQFNLSTFDDDVCRTKLETLMRQLRPKELLFTKGKLSVATNRLLKSVLPSACLWTGLRDVEGFGYDKTLVELRKLYPSDGAEDMMDDDAALPTTVPEPIREMLASRSAIESLGSMIWYLRQLNIDKDILSMKNFNVYDPLKRGQGLVLDGQTLAHIEVLVNNEGTEEGTLLKLLQRAVTPFGKRLFRIWLCCPLREISDINARLDAIQDIMDHPEFESDFMDLAKGLPDLERIVSRIHAKNCTIKDFLKVLAAFKKLSHGLSHLGDVSENFASKTIFGLLRGAPDLIQNIKKVQAMYEKPEESAGELVPQAGKDEVYDEIMTEIGDLEKQLDDELERFKKELKCKLSWHHSSIGTKDIYLIETDPKQKVPKDWTKSSSLKSKARWSAGSLQPTIRALKEARENRNTAIKAFRLRLYAEFDADRSVWLRAVRVLAELDCLFSLAKASQAIGEPCCRPEFVEGDAAWVDFKELRHPTLAVNARVESFIPNDVRLGGEVGNVALLTGPNMAGKSTVMRMTATGVIMAQLGMLVPAAEARLCPVDSILTRMGAYDNMFSNASTFKVELDECCKILRDATPKSLVILDGTTWSRDIYFRWNGNRRGRSTPTCNTHPTALDIRHPLRLSHGRLCVPPKHHEPLHEDTSGRRETRNCVLVQTRGGCGDVFVWNACCQLGGCVSRSPSSNAPTSSPKKFAEQFKAKMDKRKTDARLPLVAQADFAYLVGVATSKIEMPGDKARAKQVLARLKKTVRCYVQNK